MQSDQLPINEIDVLRDKLVTIRGIIYTMLIYELPVSDSLESFERHISIAAIHLFEAKQALNHSGDLCRPPVQSSDVLGQGGN